MEFLVRFDVTVPDGMPGSEVTERLSDEASAAAGQGHLVRLWRPPVAPGESKAIGLYRADSEAELDGLLAALPLDGWMIPHPLVLKPGLVVHRIDNGYWFWGRASFVDLWHDLRELTREIRTDWDLATPGLRKAWDTGDLSRFHGWDKRAGSMADSV